MQGKLKKIKMCQNKNQMNLISYYYVIFNVFTLKYNIYKQKNYIRNWGIKSIEKEYLSYKEMTL